MRYGHVVRAPRAPDYAALRQKWCSTVAAFARRQGLPELARRWRFPIALNFRWYEPDARRDPDGVSGGGRKVLIDALTTCTGRCRPGCSLHAGVLPTDGHRHVHRIRGEDFYVGGPEGVSVGFFEGDTVVGVLIVPLRLPDLNELLAARELGARRGVRS